MIRALRSASTNEMFFVAEMKHRTEFVIFASIFIRIVQHTFVDCFGIFLQFLKFELFLQLVELFPVGQLK